MARMKKGQEQIYYLTGDTIEDIKKSPFVERVIARGYEVLYMSDPIDEYVLQHVTEFDGKPLQNVAKDGLQLGDEDAKKQEEMEIKFAPLKEYLTVILAGNYNLEKVVISNRLTTSPCAIVAAKRGWSGRREEVLCWSALHV